jgi:ketosteroid isomerase-like protein
MDHTTATDFAARWVRDWNAHDLDALLGHFSPDVVFTSPVATQIRSGSDGVIRGQEQLRAYWSEGLRRIPDLRFEVIAVYAGVDTVVINYRNHVGTAVCEVLVFGADGLVAQGHGTYPGADAAGSSGVE